MGRRRLLRSLLPRSEWGDRTYGHYSFRMRLGRYPQDPPVMFNDHLFAFKSSSRCYDPLLQFVTDKEYAKLYVSAELGEDHVIETYNILRSGEELKAYRPHRIPCVLKPTHSSGKVVICRDSSTDLDREKLQEWFDIDYYGVSREPNYRHLVPKIIVEEFFSPDGESVPDDYKFFCVRGVPKFIQVDSDRFSGHTRNLYDTSWVRIPATLRYPGRESDDPKPALLDDMLDVARRLSARFPFVRVDLYATTEEIRVGELTFFPESASGKLEPPQAEYTLGAYFRDEGEY